MTLYSRATRKFKWRFALNCSYDGSTGWRLGLFGGVDGEDDYPEPVIVGARGMVEQQLPRLGEFALLRILHVRVLNIFGTLCGFITSMET